MYQEVEKFFTAFFGENFETSVLQAFFVCFTLMLVYGIIVRPFINLINGKQKKSFFDIITITLIILIGIKILYPDAFTFDVNVNNNIVSDTVTTPDSGNNDDKLDLPEYSSYEEVCAAYDIDFGNHASDVMGEPCGDFYFLANVKEVRVDSMMSGVTLLVGEPAFYLDGELWYIFDTSTNYEFDSGYYEILTECRYICPMIGV